MQPPLTYDLLFKKVLSNPKYPDVAIGFIHDVLGIDAKAVQFETPYNIETYKNDLMNGKLYRTEVDALVCLADNRLVSLEMQFRHDAFFKERALYYCASRYIANYGKDEQPDLDKVVSGIRYSSLFPVYGVNVLGFKMFDDKDALRTFLLYDTKHATSYCDAGGSDLFSLTFLELSKCPNTQSVKDWTDLFNGKEPRTDAPDYIKKAFKLSDYHKLSKEEQQMIDITEQHEQIRLGELHWAKTEGKAEGKAEVALNLLADKMSPAKVAELTGLSLQEINRLTHA